MCFPSLVPPHAIPESKSTPLRSDLGPSSSRPQADLFLLQAHSSKVQPPLPLPPPPSAHISNSISLGSIHVANTTSAIMRLSPSALSRLRPAPLATCS
ncbi:hypothetical protein CCHR01_10308 [Colletotrichum chrysophilum]|uniref:Uncharacterized protein n=1 Tax=Colletotrichum chrysophilum TaxID=1836956 RepID=A0AAD9AKA6_9PEZI|nr:hypothetical protein CCHR01_10308 [Colletotrichum chrysophilum]